MNSVTKTKDLKHNKKIRIDFADFPQIEALIYSPTTVKNRRIWFLSDDPKLRTHLPFAFYSKQQPPKDLTQTDGKYWVYVGNAESSILENLTTTYETLSVKCCLERTAPGLIRQGRVKLLRAMESGATWEVDAHINKLLVKCIQKIRKDTNGDYVSTSKRDENKISYAPKPTARVNTRTRTATTLSRYIRRRLGVSAAEIPDHKLQDFDRRVFAALKNTLSTRMQILKGAAVRDAYINAVGTASCMTGRGKVIDLGDIQEHYTELYAINPDKVSMIVLSNPNARALLWTCDDGTRFLDRIYPNDGPHVAELQLWAKANGVVYRHNNSLSCGGYATLTTPPARLTVTLKATPAKSAPYMDSFKFGRLNNSKHELVVTNVLSPKTNRSLQRTDGTHGRLYSEAFVCGECNKRFMPGVNDDYHIIIKTPERLRGQLVCLTCLKHHSNTWE